MSNTREPNEAIQAKPMRISIIIRTLNEDLYLDELLSNIAQQQLPQFWNHEVILVDSGSVDRTLDIAKKHGCEIIHILKSEFTFGRSLNLGCDHARGNILVFISGHCVPVETSWLYRLTQPIADELVQYSYGRQIGRDTTKYSETRVFEKYFPKISHIPQEGFFTNNANAALKKTTYLEMRFNEELTGLEDMHLAKRLIEKGGRVGYVADAVVYHIHDETWSQVRNRYERESIALTKILPEAHFTVFNLLSAIIRSIGKDSFRAFQAKKLHREFVGIVLFRANQYWGGFLGMRLAKHLARMTSKDYFYPDRANVQQITHAPQNNRTDADEGTQQQDSPQKFQGDRRKTTL